MSRAPSDSVAMPVLLLKTKSTAGDSYEDLFSSEHGNINGHVFEPIFVPVLHHRFQEAGLTTIRDALRSRRISAETDASYGGLVFTSQRAVEAFAKLVDEGKDTGENWPHLQDVPVYSVGPATTRALKSVPQDPPLQIFGEHTGNGDALSKFILGHYFQWYPRRTTLPPLLFLVGEQRRDIIPKTLMSAALPDDQRIHVDEVVVYGTGVMESFPQDFDRILAATSARPARWVVVFSPTGCDGMLRGLGMLDETTGKVRKEDMAGRRTFVATIGPTTRDYLRRIFDFEPDVCADEPSPEGVKRGILQFMAKQK
ncbi:Uroporphyrinogen-III synthase [Colletotrichum chlorophyti]|uniref:Uroporphyrinogen-III synthase n=1 Tax=Colletotrichum chlorophyti TaxID=708187 RepID=A0A1Q8S1A8_9PEZI|nr:Uroporphyrinogen-III synthase [Colletotrichum chlorophyti]